MFLVDLYDLEGQYGYSIRGCFCGFKLHAAVNQKGLPLRAKVTGANRYDSIFLPGLIEDLEANYVLADAGYDSKANKQAILSINAVPVIACNPRRRGKQGKQPVYANLLRSKRYLVEQFNGHLKENVLKNCYVRPKGLVKKAAMVFAGLICFDAEALRCLVVGEECLKGVSKYWD